MGALLVLWDQNWLEFGGQELPDPPTNPNNQSWHFDFLQPCFFPPLNPQFFAQILNSSGSFSVTGDFVLQKKEEKNPDCVQILIFSS